MILKKAKVFCKHFGCRELVDTGYCSGHKASPPRSLTVIDQSEKNQIYNYSWRKARKRFLTDNPLCSDCLEQGVVTAAQEVHHKQKARDYKSLRLEYENLMALCRRCHRIRTDKGE